MRGSVGSSEDKNNQLYTLLSTAAAQEADTVQQPAYTEVGLLALVPVVAWCLLSWALSYADKGNQSPLHYFELFAFVPAAAATYACYRIQQLRCPPATLARLKEENEWFKASNADLQQGVSLLREENDQARTTNHELRTSIKGLESVRSAIETYASRHETDFGQVLTEFQRSVAEQQSILTRTSQIQRRTRRLAEAQWRALMLNLYAQVERYAEGKRGMTRKGFEMWLAMLPTEISDRLSPETFESIDTNGDDIIEVKEMCAWVQHSVKTLLRVEQGDSDGSEESIEDSTVGTDSRVPAFVNPFNGSSLPANNAQGLYNPFRRGSAGASGSRPSSSRASGSEDCEAAREQSFPEAWAQGQSPPPKTSAATPRISGINLAAGGELKLFSTRPPARSPSAGEGGSPASAPEELAGGGRQSRRDLRVPSRSSADGSGASGSSTSLRRPSFKDAEMQKLFGSAGAAGRRGSDSSPVNQRASSTPGMKYSGAGSRSSRADGSP